MKTKKGNKLIAEFMGMEKTPYTKGFYKEPLGSDHPDLLWYGPPEDMGYRVEWNWIMPVVEKILATMKPRPDTEYNAEFDDIKQDFIDDLCDHLAEIEGYWEACIKFIKWYNKGVRGETI